MPFTFSHPAIVLPLYRVSKKHFSMTGLVVGSVIPDFEYFIRLKPQSEVSHTFLGIFIFDLPLALIMCFVFHTLVRNDLLRNLPKLFQSRLLHFQNHDWWMYFTKHWFITIVSIVVGAASHILWDSFTHKTGYFVVDTLLETKVNFGSFAVPYFKLLQHGSTLAGAIIIMVAIIRLPVKSQPTEIQWKYWLIIATAIVIGITIRILTGTNLQNFGYLIVTAISSFIIALILTPKIIRIK